MAFLSSLINILSGSVSWIFSFLLSICLWFDGLIYSLVSYSFELFMLLCQLNYNSLYFAISPLLDRVEAVIVVIILFKVSVELIQCLINPDNLKKAGPDLIKNIAIASIIIVSYNFVFGVVNELCMLVVGTPDGYEFTYLSSLADVSSEQDDGLIMRFLFGSDSSENGNVGDYLAYKTVTMFLYDSDGGNQSVLNAISTSSGEYDFTRLTSLPIRSGKIEYKYPVVSGIMGLYLVYSFVSISIQIGVRMFKLLVLQMLTPIAAISIIGGGTKAKSWSNYLSATISTFMELFIRMFTTLLTVCLILLFFENVDEFFGSNNLGTGMTEFFIIAILIVACLRLGKAIPELIDKVLGTKMAGQNNSLGKIASSVIGGGIGLGVGAITGVAAGVRSGAGWGTIGTGLTGAMSGLASGIKGNSVADKVKNISGIRGTNMQRAQDIVARGGYGMAALGGIESIVGTGNKQDRQIAALDKQSEALEAYNEAATAAVKDNKLTDYTKGKDYTYKYKDSNGAEHQGEYNKGYLDVKFGDNQDAFVENMLKYDQQYIQAQTALDVAQESGDEGRIATARANLQTARVVAEDAAKDIYKNATNHYASNDDIASAARRKYNKSAGHEIDNNIDYKAEKTSIANKKRAITSQDSYKRTHGAKPKK